MIRYLLILIAFVAAESMAAAPVVSCTPTRTCDGASNICTAPVAVLMNCSASTADALADGRTAFHSINFQHRVTTSNGDAGGNATYGPLAGSPLNMMKGPMAAFVFHTAGTYTWNICGTYEGTTTVCDTAKTFVVDSPNTTHSGTNTTCLANGAEPVAGAGGCPSGAAVAGSVTDFDAAMTTYAGTGKRVMLRGGDTFLASAAVNLASNSTLTSYGTGKAIVSPTGANNITNVNSSVSDMRVHGIDFRGISGSGLAAFNGDGSAVWNDWLFYDNYTSGFTVALNGINMVYSGAQGVYIAGNRFENMAANMTSDMIIAGHGENVVVMNNYIDASGPDGAQQTLRYNNILNSVISHNYIKGTELTDKEMVSLRPESGHTAGNIVVWANDLVLNFGYTALQVGSFVTTAQTTDVVIESNTVSSAGTTTSNAFDVIGYRVSLRNNIMDLSSTGFTRGVSIRGGATTEVDGIWVDNNTAYSNRASVNLSIIYLDLTTATTIYARNNLGYCLGGVTCTMVQDLDGVMVQTTNTGDVGTVTTSPAFIGPLTAPHGFTVGSASYAADGGTASYPAQNSDFFNCFDKSGDNRIGAVVQQGQRQCRGVAGPP